MGKKERNILDLPQMQFMKANLINTAEDEEIDVSALFG